jgi:lipopolysaccharide export system protein LptA
MQSKLFIATAASLAIAFGAFAKSTSSTNTIAIKQLKAEFKDAANVTWTSTQSNLTEASFEWNGQKLHAFYDANGEQIAVSREVSDDKLPLKALQTIKSKYAGYKTTEAIEYNSAEEGLCYYVSLENNNKKTILQVSTEGSVAVYK